MLACFTFVLHLAAAAGQASTTSCHYDCQAGLNNWKAAWAEEKKAYCCKHEKVACPEGATTLPTTTSCHYDCQSGLNNWKAAWAEEKKAYCCKHEKVACPKAPTPSSPTASTPATTTSCHFDCQSGLNNWKAAWAEEKKSYCCKHENIACPETTTAIPTTTTPPTTTTSCQYDCQSGLNNWKAAWAEEKKAYCCEHEKVGCPETTAAVPTTTTPSTTTTSHYDCQSGRNNWKAVWAEEKKAYCCKHEKVGCPETTTAVPTTTTLPTTATSSSYDCQNDLNNWKAEWPDERRTYCCEHEKVACPETTTTVPPSTAVPTSTTTLPPLPDHIMTCRLACFGTSTTSVTLPGSVGIGSGASLNDVSLDTCRRVCTGTAGCEAVMYTNETKGVPFKTMCYGRKGIHTSKCQPGGRYITEILGVPQIMGKCAVFGDPHVISFDRVYGPSITITDPGEYYLVKSTQLSIHGRFGYTRRFPSASSAVGIALGGPMVKDHTLVVAYVGPESGHKGFRVLWDGKRILSAYPSTYDSSDGVLRAKHDAMDPEHYHREGRHTIGGTEGLLPSYFFRLAPDLSIYVLVGPDNCNVVIEAPKLRDAQDGWCGNFNCDQADDRLGAMRSRGVAGPIPAGESLFKDGPTAPAWVMKRVAPPSLEDCSPTVKAAAEAKCAGLGRDERESCIFDACAADAAVAAAPDAAAEVSHSDCHKGSPMAWEHKQWRWCCEHEGVGCDVGGPCDAECMYAGRNATCKARIHWASTHLLANQQDACEQAMGLVRKQCPDACATCSLELAECLGQGSHLGIFKKFEQARQTLPETVARAGFPAQVAILGSLLAAGLAVARLRSGSIRWQLGQQHSWDVAEDLPMLE